MKGRYYCIEKNVKRHPEVARMGKLRRRMTKSCKDQTTGRGMTIQKSAQGKVRWKTFLAVQTH